MRPGEIIKRHATRSGVIAGLLSLILWPTYAMLQEPVLLPFMLALFLTAAAGLAILCVTVVDLATVRRSRLARPARAFDLALGAALALPALTSLKGLLG